MKERRLLSERKYFTDKRVWTTANGEYGVNSGEPGVSSQKQESGIISDLSFRFVNGHTESMMLPQVNYKGNIIVFMADLLPSYGGIFPFHM